MLWNKHTWLSRQTRLLRKHEDNLEEKSIAAANTSKSWVMKRLLSTSLSAFTLGVLHITSSNTHHPGVLKCLSYKIKSCAQSLVGSLEIIGGTGEGKHIKLTDARSLCLQLNIFVHVLPQQGKRLVYVVITLCGEICGPTVTQSFLYTVIASILTLFCMTCHWVWVWVCIQYIVTPAERCQWVVVR